MATMSLREQLRLQIESLPDEIVAEIADFTAFILMRRRSDFTYAEWNSKEWSEFSLAHFFRETDQDVEYTIQDAQDVFAK